MATCVKVVNVLKDESVKLFSLLTRLNLELLENQIMFSKNNNLKGVKTELLHKQEFKEHGGQEEDKPKPLGIHAGMYSLMKMRFFFIFSDGSWLIHCGVSKSLKFFGTKFTWDNFLDHFKFKQPAELAR